MNTYRPTAKAKSPSPAMINADGGGEINGIKQAIRDILSKNVHGQSGVHYESLYRTAYKVINSKRGDFLYLSLNETLSEHLEEVKNALVQNSSSSSSPILDELNVAFKEFALAMAIIRDILLYLDTIYVTANKLLPVFDLGMTLFDNVILQHPSIQSHLNTAESVVILSQELTDTFKSLQTTTKIESVNNNNKKYVHFSPSVITTEIEKARLERNNSADLFDGFEMDTGTDGGCCNSIVITTIETPEDSPSSSASSSPVGGATLMET